MKWLQGLQGRLLLVFGGVLFATLLLTSARIFLLVDEAQRQVWNGRQAESAQNADVQVRNYIDRAKIALEFIAKIEGENIEPVLESAVTNNPSFLEIIIVSESGQVINSAYQGEPVLTNLFTLAQSNWFQSVRDGRIDDFYLSPVQISSQNIPYLIMAAPATNDRVVALRLSLNVLSDIVGGLSFGETGTTFVVQTTGAVAAHPDNEIVLNAVSLSQRAELANAIANTSWTGEYVNFQGQLVSGTAAVIPDTNLVVITEITTAEATATTRNALLLLAGTNIAFWVGAMVIMIRILRVLVFSPLRRLQEGAATIQAGELSTTVPVARHDEIGQVTDAFNAMAKQLQAREIEREALINDLQAAKRAAEENARLKSEFLSTMSHELRTPMNAIEGFTSVMLKRMGGVQFNENAERYISRIQVNSKRLLSLINDFLDLSRVESGRLELARQPFSARALALRWQAEIGVLAEKKGIGLEVMVDSTLPEHIFGDEEAVTKIAINLLGNAIKFTEQGKVTLSVKNLGDQWRISVSDTGIGIPPHARDFIFEEFRQVDQTSRRKFGGTGLGLSIVQKYVRTMGGTVTVQSEVGKGSTFTVTLPLLAEEEPAEVVNG